MRQSRRQFLKTTAVGAGALSGALEFPMVSRASRRAHRLVESGLLQGRDEAMLRSPTEFKKRRTSTSTSPSRSRRSAQEDHQRSPRGGTGRRLLLLQRLGGPPVRVEASWSRPPTSINELKPRYFEKSCPWPTSTTTRPRSAPTTACDRGPDDAHPLLAGSRQGAGLPDDPDKIPMKWDEYWGSGRKRRRASGRRTPPSTRRCTGRHDGVLERLGHDLQLRDGAALPRGQVFSEEGKVVADQPKTTRRSRRRSSSSPTCSTRAMSRPIR